MKQSERVFSTVCVLFSAVMLVLCMLCSAESAAENDQVAELSQQVEALKTENRKLYVRSEEQLSLQELEEYALEKLGMQRCSPAQVFYIEHIDFRS